VSCPVYAAKQPDEGSFTRLLCAVKWLYEATAGW
jgi:hypothetical protein